METCTRGHSLHYRDGAPYCPICTDDAKFALERDEDPTGAAIVWGVLVSFAVICLILWLLL